MYSCLANASPFERATSPIRFVAFLALLAFGIAALWLTFNAIQFPALHAIAGQFHLPASAESRYWTAVAELCGAGILIVGTLGSFYLLQIDPLRSRQSWS